MTAASRRVKRSRQLWQRERYDLARLEAERFPTPAQVTAKARKRAAS